MTSARELRRQSGRLTIAAIFTTGALTAFPAVVMSSTSGDGALSPRLAELARRAVGSAPVAKQARKLGVAPSGPGSLIRRDGRVLVDVRFDEGVVAHLEALRRTGAQVVDVSRRYQTVTVAAAPESLADLGRVAGVQGVTEDRAPLVSSAGTPPAVSTTATCLGGFGAATSEGDLQLNAMKARTEFGVDGTGVTVGILSDSFNRDATAPTSAAEDVASGDLPGPGNPCGRTTPVNVIADPSALVDPEPSDEGRAMAQIVHDLAPGASLAFATAFEGEPAFAQSIEELAEPTAAGGAGAKVIADDISYFEEPFFQEGPVGVAVGKVTADGVTYYSSAGNNNLTAGGNNFASWEAPSFRDTPVCPLALETATGAEHCMDFDPGAEADPTFGLTVAKGASLTVDLQWAEPWFGVTADVDVYLLDSNGSPVMVGGSPVESTEDNVGTSQKPVEILQWENETGSAQPVQLAINRCFAACNPTASPAALPRLKFALLENGGGVTSTEYPTSSKGDVVGPTIFGHNGGKDTMSVGAIRFDTNSAPEGFSSRGPVTHYFGPVNGVIPAAPIGPEEIHKPDIVATDGGADTFFGSCVSGAWRFFGTSASAPHAAAVAALELDEESGASVAQVEQAQTATAAKVGGFPVDAVGAGMVDAAAALGQIHGSSPGGGTSSAPDFPPPLCPPVKKAAPTPMAPPMAPVLPATASNPGVPSTSFALRPHRVVRTHGNAAFVSFRFRSDQDGSFVCSIDGGVFRPCRRKLARWFDLGPHTVRVAARNSAGETDPTPATFHFRVQRVG